MCRFVGMSRQNYYAQRRARQRREVDAELVVEVVRPERQLQPRLGIRKLYHLLKGILAQAGVKLGRDRMFEILGERGMLVPPRSSEYPRTTSSYHCLPVFENLIKDQAPTRPNQIWVADITYLRTEEGCLFLSLITDKMSRKIVGYHCGETLETQECLRALEMALETKPQEVWPIPHWVIGFRTMCTA